MTGLASFPNRVRDQLERIARRKGCSRQESVNAGRPGGASRDALNVDARN